MYTQLHQIFIQNIYERTTVFLARKKKKHTTCSLTRSPDFTERTDKSALTDAIAHIIPDYQYSRNANTPT